MVSATDAPLGINLRQSNILLFEGDKQVDNGSVSITESSFSWEGQTHQFSVPYHQITLHAVSKTSSMTSGDMFSNSSAFPHPHLLIMIDGDRLWSSPSPHHQTVANGDEPMLTDNMDDSDGDVDGDSEDRASDCPGVTTLLRLVPSDPAVLDTMYSVLCECQALNPDLSDGLSESDLEQLDETEENEYVDGDDEDGELDTEQFADN
ncbi:unnamed protein product [Dicrocoelium dendriticum]|nr:unnamed protein product [Dicrocoelium dendriticum]